jgi:transcriptional regulator with XRE-family HTH domain
MGAVNKTIYSPESELLCEWLRKSREAKGLTMRDAAKLISKPHSFIGKIESGQRRLDIIEFLSYCDEMGFNPTELIETLSQRVQRKRRMYTATNNKE